MDQLLTLMPRSGKYGRFNATAAFSVAAALLALLAPNLLISVSAYVHGPISYRAAAWQSHDHGVVGLPVTSEAEFKHLRLKQKSSDLRTLVLGSSRIMGLDSGVLGSRSYNLSLSSNSAAVALAQAQIVLEFLPNLQTIYFSVDWAIGDIFYPYPVPSLTFTKTPPLNLDQIVKLARDSISMRRLSMLLRVFWDDPIAPKDLLMTGVLTSRACPDGSRSADFLLTFSVACFGFRDDGSATFDFRPSVHRQNALQVIKLSISDTSQYVRALASARGQPNHLYLSELAKLSRNLRARGGEVVIVLPPLLPGIEQAMLERSDSGAYLRAFKEEIGTWADREHIRVMDFGASERVGCETVDFMDAHHGNNSCWVKAFARTGSQKHG